MLKSLKSQSKWVSRAIRLSYFTIAYNLIEGLIAIGFGVSDDSISLAGFGVDSLTEVASAVLVLLRFRNESHLSESLSKDRERKATAGIGAIFLLLSLTILTASLFQLQSGSHPSSTVPGVIISCISLSFMFYLWSAKKKVAQALNSATVMKDADCSRACIQLSVILFLGSILFFVFPSLWWVDASAGILLAGFIAKEGWETIQAARHPEFSGGCGCSH